LSTHRKFAIFKIDNKIAADRPDGASLIDSQAFDSSMEHLRQKLSFSMIEADLIPSGPLRGLLAAAA
jgi:hypothetical protein